MSCTAEQIAEKKRQAMERLRQTKSNAQPPIPSEKITSPGTAAKTASEFYGSGVKEKTKVLNQYENKMKQTPTKNTSNRILSQPYPKRDEKSANAPSTSTNQSSNSRTSILPKVVTCKCSMISQKRFQVTTSGYHEKLVDIFKSIPTKGYNMETKIWTFDISVHDEVQKKINSLNPEVVIGPLPKFVLNLLKEEKEELDLTCLQAIDKNIASQLLKFQEYGVAFAISNNGRCMIADDMGLGKTFQAIAVADFYKDDWPLLVVITATAREGWERHIKDLLPWVRSDSIKCLTTTNEYVSDCKVLITSYSLMDRNIDRLLEKNFGFVILDESHSIKNFKTKSSQSASRLCERAKRIILLSGTPALSRPNELFSQMNLIDKKFFGGFKAYSTRYCAGFDGTFGWNSSGSSNLDELNVILQRKFMIRRTKESVEFELGSKTRETVELEDAKIWDWSRENKDALENCKEYAADVDKFKGNDRKEILLRLYAETAKIKASAVCSHVKDLVIQNKKFIIFGYHMVMLNALSDCLKKLGATFIRIDGTTRSELRNEYIDKFQKEKTCQVAVLSLKACNAAITLTAASLVVFAELDWNPSTLAQCESRAHRIGQKSAVICRYLLAKGTVDDHMWNMVKGKQDALNRAGIFSEDLTDAIHSALATSNKKVTNYFEQTQKDTKEDCQSNNNNNIESKIDKEPEKSTENSENKENKSDYKQMIDDDDGDIAMLELDF